jgi:type IV secretion system protein VirB10
VNQQPPSNPASDPNYEDAQSPSFAQERANPYFSAQQAEQAPDLDARSPELSATETQRLNRKALLFLGGILALLVVLGYFVLWGGNDEEPESTARTDEPGVVVPQLPDAMPDPVPPVEFDETPPMPAPLPVLPDSGQSYASTGSSAGSMETQGPRPPTLRERRIGSAGGAIYSQGASAGGMAPGQPSGTTTGADPQQMLAMQNALLGLPPGGAPAPTVALAPTSAQFLSNPNALLVRGTYLRCILETRIVTDIPGFTSCVLTEPVYSINGRSLLLPKGSKIMGRYQQEADLDRVAVIWDRVVTPNGIDVSMSSPGVDGLGGAGHPGDYNAHWGSKITSALLISLIADGFSYAAAKNGPETTIIGAGGVTVQEPFQSATARSMERLAQQALQKSASRPATVTINQGVMLNVYVAQDVDFSGVLAVR